MCIFVNIYYQLAPAALTVQLIVNLVDMNDNYPTFPLSQYIVQGIAETVAVGTDIIQGLLSLVCMSWFSMLI